MWYIAHPFTYHVWLLIIISIPVYMVTIGLADYVYFRYADWDKIFAFVIRNALSEQNFRIPQHTQVYQTILISIWLWSVLVLVHSYAGNLIAMLAQPTFPQPLRTLEDMLSQNKIPWAFEIGNPATYFISTAAPGTVLASLYERGTTMPRLTPEERFMYGCYTTQMMQSQRFASLCDHGSIRTLISQDYGRTAKCNYYILEEKLLATLGSHIAIQVET